MFQFHYNFILQETPFDANSSCSAVALSGQMTPIVIAVKSS